MSAGSPHRHGSKTRYFAGCTIGHSLASYSVVLLQARGEGLNMSFEVLGGKSGSLEKWRAELAHFRKGFPGDCHRLAKASEAQSQFFIKALDELMAHLSVSPRNLSAISLEGTHIVDKADHQLELINPYLLAQHFKVAVGHGFRQSDLAAGGLGHPITPMADRLLFPARKKDLLILELSACLTATYLPKDSSESDDLSDYDFTRIGGFDIGLCNHLIDGVVRIISPSKIQDDYGSLAKRGEPHDDLFHYIMQHPFFADCPNRPVYLSEFPETWFEDLVAHGKRHLPEMDLIPSVIEAITMKADQLASQLKCQTILLGGGGCQNPVLVDRMKKRLGPASVVLTDDADIPSKWLHACRMAVLGALTQDSVCISLPSVTNAKDPGLAGSWVNG